MFTIFVKRLLNFMVIKIKVFFYLFTKRLLDISLSIIGLVLLTPILVPIMFLIWRQDKSSPFYIANRVGKNKVNFRMIKLRSMIINADQSGVDSTSNNDNRITPIGQFIRSYKLDEIVQLWNVLRGEMSLVGPRPNVESETKLYTEAENLLLTVKPGITDIASIVFADEGTILENKSDPDISYNQLIRPWKSRLGIFYINNRNTYSDLKIIFLTIFAQFNRKLTLRIISKWVSSKENNKSLALVCLRVNPLEPAPPPGSNQIVTSRNLDL